MLSKKATVAKCAEIVGGAQAALDMAVNYAKERIQFGRPIGVFRLSSITVPIWPRMLAVHGLLHIK